MEKRINLPEIVGKGYGNFWRFEGRYRVVKGSRASKKSKTTALNLIYRLTKYPLANLLVVRKTERTLKDSCFKELIWAIKAFGLERVWKAKYSPLEIVNTKTGQVIYFRGMDDPLKITSVTVSTGSLCFVWVEEAYEITREQDFDMLDESIRGQLPEGYFKQITLTFNPWNERHWLKRRFFDTKSSDVLAMTTNYTCNEFLDSADIRTFEEMKKRNPRRYKVAGLGEWGVTEGLVFENWREYEFDCNKIIGRKGVQKAFGLDWGYSVDPTAFVCLLVDKKEKKIFVYDELYEKGLTNERIAELIIEMGYGKNHIRADSAEPKSIARLRALGIKNITAARKGADSVRHGIDALQDYEILIHPKCVNFIMEISNYCWEKDKFGQYTGKPEDDFNHLIDATRYALEDILDDKRIKVIKDTAGIF